MLQKKTHTLYVDEELAPMPEEHAMKKRRTSSEAPEEARLEGIEEESDALLENTEPRQAAVQTTEAQD